MTPIADKIKATINLCIHSHLSIVNIMTNTRLICQIISKVENIDYTNLTHCWLNLKSHWLGELSNTQTLKEKAVVNFWPAASDVLKNLEQNSQIWDTLQHSLFIKEMMCVVYALDSRTLSRSFTHCITSLLEYIDIASYNSFQFLSVKLQPSEMRAQKANIDYLQYLPYITLMWKYTRWKFVALDLAW